MRNVPLLARTLPGTLLDVAVAAVLVVASWVMFDRHLAMLPLLVAETVPVAFRRRWPLPALAVCIASALVGVGAGQAPSAPNFVAVLVLLATVAGAHRWRLSIPAGLVTLAATAAVVRGQALFEIGFELALVCAAWSFGNSARIRRALLLALAELAASAEAVRQQEALRAAADERAHLAREVHDVVAHSLSVIVVQAGAGRLVAVEAPEEARQALVSIERTGREALGEIRRLLGVLRSGEGSGARAPEAGLAQLDALLDRFRESGLRVDVRVDGALDDLPATVDLSAYRVVQEALTNCLRHARGAAARVSVVREQRTLVVEVTNDPGRAASPGLQGGHGLSGMRERLAVFRGDLDAGPRPGGGWRVLATLPLEAQP